VSFPELRRRFGRQEATELVRTMADRLTKQGRMRGGVWANVTAPIALGHLAFPSLISVQPAPADDLGERLLRPLLQLRGLQPRGVEAVVGQQRGAKSRTSRNDAARRFSLATQGVFRNGIDGQSCGRLDEDVLEDGRVRMAARVNPEEVHRCEFSLYAGASRFRRTAETR
jgi:hypothetical protein